MYLYILTHEEIEKMKRLYLTEEGNTCYRGLFLKKVSLSKIRFTIRLQKRKKKSPSMDSNYLSHLATNPYNSIRRLNKDIFLINFYIS